jgi:RNA polymerase sigma-70 factor (ECF subfamily)
MTAPVSSSERDLLRAAQAGDPGSLEALLSRHQGRIYRFGLRMCRDPEDARDVLQDTMLAAARSLRDYRGASALSTWLYAITRSFCLRKRRRSRFAPGAEVSLEDPLALSTPDPSPLPDQVLERRRQEAALEAALSALDAGRREVLLLRDVEGLSAADVAEATGLSVAAVKSRLHRARLELRARLAPLLGASGPATGSTPACPDVLAALTRHLEGDLSRAACAEVERHLAGCPRCTELCASLRKTLAACGALPEPRVPAALQEAVRAGIRELVAGRT